MNWLDPKTNELTEGFKEKGFLPEAFINLLALLGWNAGTEQELFTKEELIEKFSIDRVHSGGAKFDYEKAKWFNHEWIKKLGTDNNKFQVKAIFEANGITITDDAKFETILNLVADRCTLIPDFYTQAVFFFKTPEVLDTDAVKPKWNEDKKLFFTEWSNALTDLQNWDVLNLENNFKELAIAKNIKPGELQLPLRIMLVGGKFGPPVFVIAEMIGKEETIKRIENALKVFS
jgi:glutamyl-tRNA synthetase